MGESRLDELAGASPDLQLVLDEMRDSGLRAWAGRDPLLHAEVPAEHLSEFLSLLVREVPDEQLYGLALVLPACVHRRGAGHEALDHVLTGGRLSAEQCQLLRYQEIGLVAKGDLPLVLRHRAVAELAVDRVRLAVYAEFLHKHGAELARIAPGDLGLVVLDPRVEPGIEVFECLEAVILHAPDPRAFVRQACDWVRAGTFDLTPERLNPGTGTFYGIVEERWDDERFVPIRQAAFSHLLDLVRAPDDLAQAWYHLCTLAGLYDEPRLGQEVCDLLAQARIPVTPYQRTHLVPLLHLLQERQRPAADPLATFLEQRERRERIVSDGPPPDRPEDDRLGSPGDPSSYLLPPGR